MKLPELDSLFRELLAFNRSTGYGISVVSAAPDLSIISVDLHFLAGRIYCCAEPGCHIPRHCEKLVRLAAKRSIKIPDDVLVRWHCRVEKGARLQCLSALGYSPESEAYEIDAVSGDPAIKMDAQQEKPPTDFTGLWIVKHSEGARIEIEYIDGIPNGRFRNWHEGGTCIREGFKKNGQWDATLITRNADGTVLDVSEFNEGTGVYRIFNSNGQLTDEIPLRSGKPHGAAKRWCLGKLVEIRHYVEGQCVAANCEA